MKMAIRYYCERCKWWRVSPQERQFPPPERSGECMRHPPTVVPELSGPTTKYGPEISTTIYTVRPETKEDDYCGECEPEVE